MGPRADALVTQRIEEDGGISHVLAEFFERVNVRFAFAPVQVRGQSHAVRRVCVHEFAELAPQALFVFAEEAHGVFSGPQAAVRVAAQREPAPRCVKRGHGHVFEGAAAMLGPRPSFAGELPKLPHLLGDVAEEVLPWAVMREKLDALQWISAADEAAVFYRPAEVSEEPASERVAPFGDFLLMPQVDVDRDVGVAVSHPERPELFLHGFFFPVEGDEQVDVRPAVVRALEHAAEENPPDEPRPSGEPVPVRLREDRERSNDRYMPATDRFRDKDSCHCASPGWGTSFLD